MQKVHLPVIFPMNKIVGHISENEKVRQLSYMAIMAHTFCQSECVNVQTVYEA